MRIKPFLTISDVKSDSVVLGVTKRFRTDVPLPIDTHDYKRELLVRAINADETIGNRLAELGLLINDEPYVERDSRTLSFLSLFTDSPLAKLAELRKQKILVAGCGGLGSRIVLELASLGIRNLTVIDPDVLSESNIPRMFYVGSEDIDKKKVEIIEKKVRNINQDISFRGVYGCSEKFLLQENLSGFDFIFVTADGDDGAALKRVGDHLRHEAVPHVPAGYWESTAIVGPIISCQSSVSLSDLYEKYSEPKRRTVQRDYIPPSIGFVNSIIAGMAINEFVKFAVFNASSLIDRQWQCDLIDLRTAIVPV